MLTSLPNNATVANYCNAMDRREVIINRTYQRSDLVWPPAARAFLIESILLGFPIPKIFLHSVTDLKSRRTVKEVVDGQQRSRAIHDYFHDGFALSTQLATADIRGKRYSDLDDDWKNRFLTYSISIDEIIGAEPAQVRELFKRINSYTAPANPEELRHAEFQGTFKWEIYRLSERYGGILVGHTVFTEKALIRMQDEKLFTEVAHAIDKGITTTNRKTLDSIYRRYDEDADGSRRICTQVGIALDTIVQYEFLAGSALAKPHVLYALLVAILASRSGVPNCDVVTLTDMTDTSEVEQRLLPLADALARDQRELMESPWYDFAVASATRTNVKEQRESRVHAFQRALAV